MSEPPYEPGEPTLLRAPSDWDGVTHPAATDPTLTQQDTTGQGLDDPLTP